MTTRDIVFVAVGAVTALSALLSVTTKHVVHAALWLLVSLGSLAGAYLVLGQELVGLVQLLVYVGAIVVLVLFALMLTRAPIGPHAEIDTPRWQRVAGAVLGGATTALLASLLLPLFSGATANLDTPTTTTPQVAQAVFGTWVWPFELLSVLLLVALIGAFAVSRLVLQPDGDRDSLAVTSATASATASMTSSTSAVGTGTEGARMIHLSLPAALAALLAGIGVYGVLARRNAVLVLIGVELILNAANLLLVTAGSRPGAPLSAGPVLTLFVITIAAAEITVALAIILVMFRRAGHIDLTAVPDLTDEPAPAGEGAS